MEGEDPTRRNNFTLPLHGEISVRVVPKKKKVREGIKNDGRQKQKLQFGPFFSLNWRQ